MSDTSDAEESPTIQHNTNTATNESYDSLKLVDIKNLLRDRGLSVTGNKPELIQRLRDYDANPSSAKAARSKKRKSDGQASSAGPPSKAAAITNNEHADDEDEADDDSNKPRRSSAAAVVPSQPSASASSTASTKQQQQQQQKKPTWQHYNNLGCEFVEKHRDYQNGIEQFNKAMEELRESGGREEPVIFFNRARAYRLIGGARLSDAKKDLDKAIAITPAANTAAYREFLSDVYVNYGVLYLEEAESLAARSGSNGVGNVVKKEESESSDGDDHEPERRRKVKELANKALELFNKALQVNPKSALARGNRAAILQELKYM